MCGGWKLGRVEPGFFGAVRRVPGSPVDCSTEIGRFSYCTEWLATLWLVGSTGRGASPIAR